MPALGGDGQFKFLVCCIKHSTAGKVDFVAVASELGIVSKAAAAKRYERLLKAHGAGTSGSRGGTPASATSTPVRGAKRPSAKRTALSSLASDDDEDVKPDVSSERDKATRSAERPAKRTAVAKKERKAELSRDDQTNGLPPAIGDGEAPKLVDPRGASRSPFDHVTDTGFRPQATVIASDEPPLSAGSFAIHSWLAHPQLHQPYRGMCHYETQDSHSHRAE